MFELVTDIRSFSNSNPLFRQTQDSESIKAGGKVVILQLQIICSRNYKGAAHIHLRIFAKEHTVRIQEVQISPVDVRPQHPINIRSVDARHPADYISNVCVGCCVGSERRTSTGFDIKLAETVK